MIYPARIKSYDSTNQTCNIIISAEEIFDGIDGIGQLKERPVLEEVPVHISSGGGWSLTFPIKEGDTCLLILSAIGYDHWFVHNKDKAGNVAGHPAPHLYRKFDYNDGFAIVGFNTLKNSVDNCSSTDSEWRNEDKTQSIVLSNDGTIKILGDVTITGSLSCESLVATTSVKAGSVSLEGHVHSSNGATGSG